MKKNIIIVSSLFNLILAIQIRKRLYADEAFDLVLTDKSSGLREIYDSRRLEGIFDNVFFANTDNLAGEKSRIIRAKALFSPDLFFKEMTRERLSLEYTDIFFWNPDMIFYGLIMTYNMKKIGYSLHLYGDTAGAYMVEEPLEEFPFPFWYYKNTLIQKHLKKRYKLKMIKEMSYDYYLFAPEYGINSGNRKYVSIPCIEKTDENKTLFNKLLINQEINIDEYKYIIFDRPVTEINIDREKYKESIELIVKKVGRENIVVKKHPRSTPKDTEIYDSFGIKMIVDPSPWELYCLNHDVSDKVYITITSSAVFLPRVLYGTINNSIMLYRVINLVSPEATEFYDRIEEELFIPNNIDELSKILFTIEGK